MTSPQTTLDSNASELAQRSSFWTDQSLADYGLLLIILLGAGLRLYNLTYHSLWFDEAISIRWASTTVPEIIEVSMNLVEDRLPPLYYLLLKGWGDLFGLFEYSVRLPSVLIGVLLIPVVYALGARLFRPNVGRLAALLTALNPFLIWYSQEARMYALAALTGSLGVLAFVVAVQTSSPRRAHWAWIGLGLAALAGLYTHLYSGFLWPALALWLLINPQILRRVWRPFTLTMSTVLLLFLPLAQAVWRFSGESTPADPLADPGSRLIDLFEAFVIWQAVLDPRLRQVILIGLAIFLVAGLVVSVFQRKRSLVPFLLLMPFAIASILLLRSELAFFGQRYFIGMVPWLLLLQAAGALARLKIGPSVLGRILAIGGVLLLVGLTAIPVSGQWQISASKEAWRQTLAYMTTYVQPDEGVLIHPEWVRFPYQYYAGQMHTPGQTYAAFSAVDETTDLDGPLTGVLADHPVIWLIQSHVEQPDPEKRVESWFAARYPLVTELYPPGIVLKAYAPGYQSLTLPPEATSMEIAFPAGLQLLGFELAENSFAAEDHLFHPPSTWIHVTLYWAASERAQDVVPYAHLIDDLGQVWGASLDRSSDATRLYPPSRWGPEQVIQQDLDVNLNPATPEGTYQLVVGIGEQKVFLAAIQIVGE